MHDAYTIGIPVLVFLIANFISRADLKELRAETSSKLDKMDQKLDKMQAQIDDRFEKMQAQMDRRFDDVDADLRYFHGQDGRHDARLTLLKKRQG